MQKTIALLTAYTLAAVGSAAAPLARAIEPNRVPEARGSLDTAPVMAYAHPTSLQLEDAGFRGLAGTLALAITSHPDFDDSPLRDEDADRHYANDGRVFHPHGVALGQDERMEGGLSVVAFKEDDPTAALPPTHPGMPIAMDSPGYPVLVQGSRLRMLVSAYRIAHQTAVQFGAVSCYLEVNTSDDTRPMLGVYQVYEVESGDLSLPYTVDNEDAPRP